MIDSLQFARQIAAATLDKQAMDPVLIHVADLVSYADYVLIVSASSSPQMDAIARHCAVVGKSLGQRALSIEGRKGGGDQDWFLVDFGDLVLHIFRGEARQRYDLEGLWLDALKVALPGVLAPVPNKYVAAH